MRTELSCEQEPQFPTVAESPANGELQSDGDLQINACGNCGLDDLLPCLIKILDEVLRDRPHDLAVLQRTDAAVARGIPLLVDPVFHQDLEERYAERLAADVAVALDVGTAEEAIHLRQ